jgi:hypothetical protein
MVCLKCDNIDPMKTDAAKWAASSLATPARESPSDRKSLHSLDIEEDL